MTDIDVATGLIILPIHAKFALVANAPNAAYAPLLNVGISAVVLLSNLAIARFGKGSWLT